MQRQARLLLQADGEDRGVALKWNAWSPTGVWAKKKTEKGRYRDDWQNVTMDCGL